MILPSLGGSESLTLLYYRDVIILSADISHYISTDSPAESLTVLAGGDHRWWLAHIPVATDVTRYAGLGLMRERERERERTNSPPGPHHTLPVFSVVVIICSSPSTATTTDYLISSYQLFTLDEFFIVCLKSSKIPVWRYVLRLSESVLVCRGDSEEVWATFHTEF